MATRLYHIDKGGNYSTVTQEVGSATTNGVELTVDLAKVLTKKELIIALEELLVYITRADWAPA